MHTDINTCTYMLDYVLVHALENFQSCMFCVKKTQKFMQNLKFKRQRFLV